MRFNDGKVDRFGRLYTGTMLMEGHGDVFKERDGKLYRFDGKLGKGFIEQKDGIGISNGITWNKENDALYYVDSCAFDVKVFQINAAGDLMNEQVLIDFSNNGKIPGFVGDGMPHDAEGNLYLAAWCGSKVLKIDPAKRSIVQEIGLPVTQVTSVAFGGPRLDELFVTTAATEIFDGTEGLINLRPPGSGKVFKVTGLAVKGQGMNKIVLNE
ncbi:regucalcin-like [Wyeomyia smithii]|uniref:regucalcin-like n=1 Tax=Wyeomyia smithii TaxID=174621 RepID=UPI002467D0B3|nr:regucalcin-like [Wyeomyia smithii]